MFRGRPRLSAVLCATMLAPLPFSLQVPSDSTTSADPAGGSSTSVRFTFGAGGGTFGRSIEDSRMVYLGPGYGCAGGSQWTEVKTEFLFRDEYRDYGGDIDIQPNRVLHVGARGGWVDEDITYLGATLEQAYLDTLFNYTPVDTSKSFYYINPWFAFEWRMVGLGLGFVYAPDRLWEGDTVKISDAGEDTFLPTAHLRLGRLDKIYALASFREGVPIYSGGGETVVGLGVRPVRAVELFGGFATGGPYTTDGAFFRGNFDISPRVTLGGAYRIPTDADEIFSPNFNESGISFSLSYRAGRR